MATNLKIDEELLTKARRLAGLKTKRETVNQALAEFVQHREQQGIKELQGQIEYWEDYDYKKSRIRK
jgi:Arc/MetJ family transcription regulator